MEEEGLGWRPQQHGCLLQPKELEEYIIKLAQQVGSIALRRRCIVARGESADKEIRGGSKARAGKGIDLQSQLEIK